MLMKRIAFTKADLVRNMKNYSDYSLQLEIISSFNQIINETVTVEVIEEPGDKGGCKLGTADLVNYFLGFSASLGLTFIVLKIENNN